MTSPQLNRPNPRSGRWFIVLGAAVLGVFVFCGIVVAAAGSKDPKDTGDVSRTGALAMATPPPTSDPASAAATTMPVSTAPVTTPPPAPTTTAAVTTTPPAAKAPTTKAPAPKPPTTKPASNCNPNYSPCVPNDPVDVDCKPGSGNGPSYVQGPVRVIGTDVYDLDRDGDGIGCD